MDGKQKILIAAIGVVLAMCVAAAVTASSETSHTPLYTLRMEQASSEKSFLPTERTPFTYSTKSGYTLVYDVSACCGNVEPFYTGNPTCPQSCEGTCDDTCEEPTCPNTCPNTCTNTCPSTCTNTCPVTCEESCEGTCWTCPYTCVWTCSKTCNTCYSTSRCCP